MAETDSQSAALEQEATVTSPAALLLAELRHVHELLLRHIAELERITRGPAPEEKRFTKARWNLSRASLKRRMLWARILGYLRPLVGERDASDLRRLQDTDIELLRTSIRHVARWTTENALSDWRGYCAASRIMRGKMAAAIEGERRVLYPMLEEIARRQVGGARDEPGTQKRSKSVRRANQEAWGIAQSDRSDHPDPPSAATSERLKQARIAFRSSDQIAAG